MAEVVRPYAEAVLAIAEDRVACYRNLAELTEIVSRLPDLKQLLVDSATRPAAGRQDTIAALLPDTPEPLRRLLGLLALEGKLTLLPAITAAALSQLRASGVRVVELDSTETLSDGRRQAILRSLQIDPARSLVQERVTPALLGGLRVRVDDLEHDFSLAGRLDRLRTNLVT